MARTHSRRPSTTSPCARAWAGRKGLGKEQAMQQYVALVDRLLQGR